MKPPIPAYTIPNLCGALGDIIRAAAAWGAADALKTESDMHTQILAQTVMQALTLCLQREPTENEMAAVVGG